MIIHKVKLVNFRNYKKQQLTFNKNINIIIGDNAQGKTNILESVYFLALTKSYRTQDINLINKNFDFCKVIGDIKIDSITKKIAVELANEQKKVYINDTEIKKIGDYITNLNVILFSPEDIIILSGSPADRRNFLNIELSQLSSNYLKKYNEFNKLLKIRNNYLKMLNKSSQDMRYLDSLTEKLIEREIDIYIERNNFINKINNNISKIFKDISGVDNLFIKYENNVDITEYEREKIKEVLENKYKKNISKEIEYGMTLYGPHRDDFKILINEDDIQIYGSEGQQKIAIISLKLSEINIFKETTNTYPVILLDDVFSELDAKKRNKLIKYINNDIQVIITTNDLKGLSKKLVDNSKIIKVINGNIIEKNGE